MGYLHWMEEYTPVEVAVLEWRLLDLYVKKLARELDLLEVWMIEEGDSVDSEMAY